MYVKPLHLRETTRCWRDKKAMYGTQSASEDFKKGPRQSMEVVGMTRSSVPTMFPDRNDDVAGAGHGDGLLVDSEAEHSMKSIEGRPETIGTI